MDALFTAIFNTPVATILIIAGLIFLGIGVIGKVSGKIEPSKGGRIASGAIGITLLVIGFATYLGAIVPSSTSGVATTQTDSFAASPTITPQAPRIYHFSACPERCSGSNATRVFPEATTELYVRWEYENIPIGANYARVWSMDGQEWIRYQCSWPGPNTGVDSLNLREPGGLHSGSWEVTIVVDGVVLLREEIQVQGNWTYWDPAGTRNSCYDD